MAARRPSSRAERSSNSKRAKGREWTSPPEIPFLLSMTFRSAKGKWPEKIDTYRAEAAPVLCSFVIALINSQGCSNDSWNEPSFSSSRIPSSWIRKIPIEGDSINRRKRINSRSFVWKSCRETEKSEKGKSFASSVRGRQTRLSNLNTKHETRASNAEQCVVWENTCSSEMSKKKKMDVEMRNSRDVRASRETCTSNIDSSSRVARIVRHALRLWTRLKARFLVAESWRGWPSCPVLEPKKAASRTVPRMRLRRLLLRIVSSSIRGKPRNFERIPSRENDRSSVNLKCERLWQWDRREKNKSLRADSKRIFTTDTEHPLRWVDVYFYFNGETWKTYETRLLLISHRYFPSLNSDN